MAWQDTLLSDLELSGIYRFEKSFGKDWVERSIVHIKVKKYIEQNFSIVDSDVRQPYRCCREGHYTYVKKNNELFTENDIEALQKYELGQMNKITGNPGDKQVRQDWLCDSGD